MVGELPPQECLKFWGKRASRIAPREIIDVLSVTGGVPRYLEDVDPSLSAIDNIKGLCFMPKSVLREDFDDMFDDVITEQPKFSARVLRTFVDGAKTATEVADALGITKGGDVTTAIGNLVDALLDINRIVWGVAPHPLLSKSCQILSRCFLSAMATASDLLAAPSLLKIAERWFLTVISARPC